MRNQDQQSKALYELCALILSILRSPSQPMDYLNRSSSVVTSTTSSVRRESAVVVRSSTVQPSSASTARSGSSSRKSPQISPAGFASLLLGVSLSLMLCGSVTFVIGFILMPWVLGLVTFFYFVGIVSSISVFGRGFLCPSSTQNESRKKISEYW